MVLKTHLFIKNISLSLQKLRQYKESETYVFSIPFLHVTHY